MTKNVIHLTDAKDATVIGQEISVVEVMEVNRACWCCSMPLTFEFCGWIHAR